MMFYGLLITWLILTVELGVGVFNLWNQLYKTQGEGLLSNSVFTEYESDDGIRILEEIQELKIENQKLRQEVNETLTVTDRSMRVSNGEENYSRKSEQQVKLEREILRLQKENQRLQEKVKDISNTLTASKDDHDGNSSCNCSATSGLQYFDCDTLAQSCKNLSLKKNCPQMTIKFGSL